MSSNLGTIPPKLLPISTEHGEKDPHVIGQYEGGSKNSVIEMRAFKMKKVEDVHAVVEQNTRHSVREMSQTLCDSTSTVSRQLQSIVKVKTLNKWFPHELSEHQKLRRFKVCSTLCVAKTNDMWTFYDNLNNLVNGLIVINPPNTSQS